MSPQVISNSRAIRLITCQRHQPCTFSRTVVVVVIPPPVAVIVIV